MQAHLTGKDSGFSGFSLTYFISLFMATAFMPLLCLIFAELALLLLVKGFLFTLLLGNALMGYGGYFLGQRLCLPRTLLQRFLPIAVPIVMLFIGVAIYGVWFSTISMNWLPDLMDVMLAVGIFFANVFAIGFACGGKGRPPMAEKSRGTIILVSSILVSMVVAAGVWEHYFKLFSSDRPEPVLSEDIDSESYMPFEHENNLLAVPYKEPEFYISSNWPRLGGMKSLLPYYGAVAQAVYHNVNATSSGGLVSTAPLVESIGSAGETTDIVFGLKPSATEENTLDAKKKTWTYIPFGKDALVFITESENPLTDLSAEQIAGIFTGKITNWKELGGSDLPITVFKGSVADGLSRRGLANYFAESSPFNGMMMCARPGGKGDVVQVPADYYNVRGALGVVPFSFIAEEYDDSIRMMSVDGVAPSINTIRQGTYPFGLDLYAIISGELSKESKALLQWITSVEGQALLEETGFVTLIPHADERPKE